MRRSGGGRTRDEAMVRWKRGEGGEKKGGGTASDRGKRLKAIPARLCIADISGASGHPPDFASLRTGTSHLTMVKITKRT